MGGSLLDAPPMINEAGYEYKGNPVCMVGEPTASLTDSSQYMIRVEVTYQYWSNATFDDVGDGSNYVITIIEYVERESNDHVPLNQKHICNDRVEGLKTITADATIFKK